jgi:hypothetical protein
MAWRRMSQHTLRITIQDDEQRMTITLEGRVVGPWAEELGRVWVEAAPRLGTRKLVLDLRNVTYADAGGNSALRTISSATGAELVASTPWSQYIAGQVRGNEKDLTRQGAENAGIE